VKLVHFYLGFPGTAREAFEYYEKVFGTKIVGMQTYGQTSFVGPVPDSVKDKIMNIQLPISETVHLMASDSAPGFGPQLIEGNNFNIVIVANDKEEADRVFAALSKDGKETMPIANAPWGPYFGMCRDKFGIQWMVSLDHPV
jgi:PhnB protein